jgi:hypothetical protein
MNLFKQAFRIAISVGLFLAVIGLATPAQAGGGGGGEGLKKRVGARMEVDQLYRDILGHPADEDAIRLYGDALEHGTSTEMVRKMIAFSPEAGLVINDHFRKFTGREATSEEMQKVRKELNAGATISDLDSKLAKMRGPSGEGHGKGKHRFNK